MGFMGEKNISCILLSHVIRVRLFLEDLKELEKNGIDVQEFIQRAVNIQVRILKKWR